MTMEGRQRFLRKMEKLAQIQGAPRQKMRGALETNAKEITSFQKQLAPKDDGDLERSISYTFGTYRPENANVRGVAFGGGGDPDLTVTLHAGDAKAFYAAFVEFGTAGPYEIKGRFAGSTHPGITAQPYFFPAYRALKRRAKTRLTRVMKKAIRDSVR